MIELEVRRERLGIYRARLLFSAEELREIAFALPIAHPIGAELFDLADQLDEANEERTGNATNEEETSGNNSGGDYTSFAEPIVSKDGRVTITFRSEKL